MKAMEVSTCTFPQSLVAPLFGLLQGSLGSHIENAEGLVRTSAYAEAEAALLLGVEKVLKLSCLLSVGGSEVHLLTIPRRKMTTLEVSDSKPSHLHLRWSPSGLSLGSHIGHARTMEGLSSHLLPPPAPGHR